MCLIKYKLRRLIKGLQGYSNRSSRRRSSVANAVFGGPQPSVVSATPGRKLSLKVFKMPLRVACRNSRANSVRATEGGVPMSLLPVRPVSQGNKEGHRKGRAGRGAKGPFQGEQRPTETEPPTTTNGG